MGAFEKARIEERFIRAKDTGTGKIGHFGYFKETSAATLWADTVAWMEREGVPLPEVAPLRRES
jgi:predicted alpha/beta hydrolase